MPLFGDLDAEDVSENPFYVAPDTYNCVLTEANVVQKKDQSGEGLSFKWIIEDEDSDYVGNSLSDWFNIYPDLNEDDIEELPPEKRSSVRKDRSRLKQRLVQMELTGLQMNTLLDDDNLDDLIGMQGLVEVTESKDKNDPDKTYTNIRSVKRTDTE